jgi:hypothetical protein
MAGISRRNYAREFMQNIDQSGGPTACWPFGRLDAKGYGCFGRYRRRATHIILELEGRPLTPGQIVRHTCDNPACVNPHHLVAGTHAQNVDDMIVRGRKPRGQKHKSSKLSDADLKEILWMYAQDGSIRQIARCFKVTEPRIGQIVRGESRYTPGLHNYRAEAFGEQLVFDQEVANDAGDADSERHRVLFLVRSHIRDYSKRNLEVVRALKDLANEIESLEHHSTRYEDAASRDVARSNAASILNGVAPSPHVSATTPRKATR